MLIFTYFYTQHMSAGNGDAIHPPPVPSLSSFLGEKRILLKDPKHRQHFKRPLPSLDKSAPTPPPKDRYHIRFLPYYTQAYLYELRVDREGSSGSEVGQHRLHSGRRVVLARDYYAVAPLAQPVPDLFFFKRE